MTALKTQNWKIWRHLKIIGPLTPMTALRKYGVFRLGARIWDLRRDGWRIKAEKVKVKTRGGIAVVCRYSMDCA